MVHSVSEFDQTLEAVQYKNSAGTDGQSAQVVLTVDSCTGIADTAWIRQNMSSPH
ncbi:unnamed protein product [Nippostrongylus brasiliensis]|uniref:Lipoprotein n=1 Tax=Nippostrongylus brasiliensis TaxID=27835 RepID=A0A0N4XPK1_NIPBR|nr:unnamed protein product [Nippostrongylus brasiliensis]